MADFYYPNNENSTIMFGGIYQSNIIAVGDLISLRSFGIKQVSRNMKIIVPSEKTSQKCNCCVIY
jgi:hypothetical protein